MIVPILVAALTFHPSPEAEALGRRLAATGALETLLPAITAKETEEVGAQHPELSAADRAALRETCQQVSAAVHARLIDAIGEEYAAALAVTDLRNLVAFAETPAARRYRAAIPGVTMRGLATLGQVDFKGDLAKAFCTKTGKLCPH